MKDPKAEFIEYELACLWSDLELEERYSLSTSPAIPSIAMVGIMERIKQATALVGPVDWIHVSMVALVNGGYERWAKHMGIEYNLPTEEELSEMKSVVLGGGWNENL